MKSNDPDAKLEALEGLSGWATLVILAGIFVEIGVVWFRLPLWNERVWSTIADGLIGLGLIAEYIVIRLTIIASGESKSASDTKLTAAIDRVAEIEFENGFLQERTAMALERSAKAELELARIKEPRRLSMDQRHEIALALVPFAPMDFHVSVSFDEPEQRFLADAIIFTLQRAGWRWVNWDGPAKDAIFIREGTGFVKIGGANGVVSGMGVVICAQAHGKPEPSHTLVNALGSQGLEVRFRDPVATGGGIGIQIAAKI